MQHFQAIIDHLITVHKNPNTNYAEDQMFASANELSFAISRLMDAHKIFASETLDNKELTPPLREAWFSIRESMPEETAQNIALCIMKNTPLSSTQEQIETIRALLHKALYEFSDNLELADAFSDIFFLEKQIMPF